MNHDSNSFDPRYASELTGAPQDHEYLNPLEELSSESDDSIIDAVSADSALDESGAEHVQAAVESQQAAEAAIEVGDYASALEHRREAESEAEIAGNDEILTGADSIELEAAADHLDRVAELGQSEATHVAEGNYEAARDDAFEAGWHQQQADALAGGDDHSGQADLEYQELDAAVWDQSIANEQLDTAGWYAESGDVENAGQHLEAASEHQQLADQHAAQGQHGGELAIDDPFSLTANDMGFDFSTDQTTDYSPESPMDAGGFDSYDPGFDSGGVDTGGIDTGGIDTGGYSEY